MDFIGSQNPQPGFRNLIVNGNFAINQRGYVSGTAISSGYGFHDRWLTVNGATVTFTQASLADLTAGGAIDTPVAVTGQNLLQIIEGRNIAGGIYTLSWSGNSTAYVQYYNGTTYVIVAAGGSSPLITSAIPQGATTMVVFNTGGTGLTKIQFEQGAAATLFERRPYGIELSLCQRYFIRLGGHAYRRFALGIATTTTNVNAVVIGQVQNMRANPTLTTGGNLCVYAGGVALLASAITSDTVDAQQIGLNITATSLTAGAAYLLCANNDATAHIDLSADI